MNRATVVVVRLRKRALTREWLWFGAISLGVAAFYFAVRAPVLDPPYTLDPWIYTALFVNFGFLYEVFDWSYYPSRLGWVVPGVAVHSVLPPVAAFFVLHATYFFGAGLFAYLLVRRFAGAVIALAAYAALLLSPLFYNAYSNDYPDGALITYLLGGVYFALTAAGSPRPRLRAFWSGFFLAAAMATNLFAGVVIACLLALYAVARIEAVRARGQTLRDAAFAAIGAVALFLACATFSLAHGGAFFFFLPSLRAVQSIDPADYKASGYSWILREPQLLIPAFVSILVLVLAAGGARDSVRRRDPGWRLAVGAGLFTSLFLTLLVVWEVWFTGNFLETSYYFSLFNVGIVLSLGGVLYLLGELPGRWTRSALVGVVVAAAVIPTLLTIVFRAFPVGRQGWWVVVGLMVVTLGFVAGRRRLGRLLGRGPAVVALAFLVVFTTTYAADAGSSTRSVFQRNTYGASRDTLAVALQLIDFMRDSGLQERSFQFWYDSGDDPSLNGIQSVYLWGITWVGLDMPKVEPSMRKLLEARKPSALVLLCRERACQGAPAALTAAGYPNAPLAEDVLEAGSERVWVRAFDIPQFAAPTKADLEGRFFTENASPFAAAPSGEPAAKWPFSAGVPEGWSGDARDAAASANGGAFRTTRPQWSYQLVSPEVTLAPGSYTAFMQGRVLRGGVDLGVLDARQDAWIEQRFYWFGQVGFDRRWMATPFRVERKGPVKVILSNWVPEDRVSEWQIGEIQIVRTG